MTPVTPLTMWLCAVGCLIALAAPSTLSGQPAPDQPRRGGAGEGARAGQRPGAAAAGVTPGEIAQMLNAMMMMRAQEVLALRDDQYAPFITALRAFLTTRQRLGNQRQRLIRDLRMSLQGREGSEALIAERLRAVRDHDASAVGAMKQAWDSLDQVLDVRQQGRFRVLEQEMEQQQLDLLMRARGAARGAARGR